jgi:hypothetical protein
MTRFPDVRQPRAEPLDQRADVPPSATQRRRRTGFVVAVAAGMLALLAGGTAVAVGITDHRKPTTVVQAAPRCDVIGVTGCESTAANAGGRELHTADPGQVLPASIKRACDLNGQMRKATANADLRDQGATISQIQALAGNTTVSDIKVQANILKDRYDLAVSATDDPASYAATVNLFAASTQLLAACLKAGWTSA